jgi:hypothetical protein
MLSAVLAEQRKFGEAIANAEAAIAIFAHNHGESNSFVEFRRGDVERMRNRDSQPYLDG